MLTASRKRSLDVEELPPAKRISRKCVTLSQKPEKRRKVAKSKGSTPRNTSKQTIVSIVTCNIPANILDLSSLTVVKPRKGRSAKK